MNTAKQKFVHVERIKLLYAQSFAPIILSVISGAVLVATLWLSIDTAHLVWWLATIASLASIRFIVVLQFKRTNPQHGDVLKWERAYVISLLILYLCWSAGLIWFMPKDNLINVFILCIFSISLTIVAFNWYSSLHYLQIACISIALLPMIAALFTLNGYQTSNIAIGGIFLYIAFIFSSFGAEKNMKHNLESAYHLLEAKIHSENMTKIDTLTGLYNRHAFFNEASLLFEACKQNNEPVSLLIMNIDQFKKINDDLGHAIGDEVLAKIAGLIKKNVRKVDYLCRYDGQEFVILIPNTTSTRALETANQLKKEIGTSSALNLGETPYPITASFGVADIGKTLTALLSHATEAMHEAKNAGRNQAKIHRLVS